MVLTEHIRGRGRVDRRRALRFWVGITDVDWYRQLSRLAPDEVNFWQPSARRMPVALPTGAPFLFKLHAGDGGAIVGGGFVAHHTALPVRLAWDAFGEKNGTPSLAAMTERIAHYRRAAIDPETHQIGCYVLTQPFFFDRAAAIAAPVEWARGIQQGRTFDTKTPAGAALWQLVEAARAPFSDGPAAVAETSARYGAPVLVTPRLGQGSFRVIVTDAYARRCAITGERTLPVLEAAHIRPYSQSGPHEISNGLLLRTDLHTLFDRGYITVSPDLTVRVSRRIRDEFENGREYYALEGRPIAAPQPGFTPPGRDYLEWHGDTVFRT